MFKSLIFPLVTAWNKTLRSRKLPSNIRNVLLILFAEAMILITIFWAVIMGVIVILRAIP